MGTRADFYVGRGKSAEWCGSIAWDGYPEGISKQLLASSSTAEFRARLSAFFAGRDDVTLPERGWPWPWNDSRTTDYSYAFDEGRVWASCFGHAWFCAALPEPENSHEGPKIAVFPNMTGRKNVRLDRGSGIIVVEGTSDPT